MRQARKQEILSFIDSLQQAHGEIKEAMEKQDKASAQAMLAECQEFAVELGSAIEKTEGEDCISVSYIEAYCETLFRVFEELDSQKKENISCDANKVYKTLKKYLLRVENSVKNDIPLCKEVVFFPYKASMWDSLESVYFAAKEEADCEVYCVPIPYYDLNADHSFGTIHYEGHEFPENVEITDWRDYNFEERKPDIIFIHNPYDGWNNVTSVHPRYYAKNLQEYTKKLVYIPYFILDEVRKEDLHRQEWIEGVRHFCFLPGTLYANKVIVQSEDMRQIYIKEYLKEAKQLGIPVIRKELENKILGIGSPKIDKVLNTEKDILEIPEKWREIIQKSDGSRKIVIFYNLGVSALLKHGEKWLSKVKDVFFAFKENQKSIALLWRPHPLIESTMKSMRPELLEKYLEIRNEYINEGWGIYDDTANLDRAIVLSDAYYGDGSSVAQLFRQVAKPVMWQNVNVQWVECCSMENIEPEEIITTEGVIIDNYIYFIANCVLIGAVMKIDMRTWKVSYVKDIANYYPDVVSRIGSMVRDGNIVYCLRLDGRMISVFDLSNKTCDYIDTEFRGENWGSFVAFEKYKEFLYLFSSSNYFAIKIDIKRKSVDKIYFTDKYGIDYHDHEKKIVSFSVACLVDDSVWLFQENENEVISYNMNNNTWKSYYILKESQGCHFAVYQESSFFLLDNANRVFQWNPYNQEITKLWENELYLNKKCNFRNLVVTEMNIILLPCFGDEIIIIDRKSSDENIYDKYPEEFRYMASMDSAKFVNGCEDKDYFYYLTFSANHILCINKSDGKIKWIKPELPTKKEKCFFAGSNYEIFTEEMIDLKNYMYNVAPNVKNNIFCEQQIGKKIWDDICK